MITELEAMRRALDLAAGGWGRAQPNPMVGAVVLSEGAIVGEGFHAEFGGPHAERIALRAAGARARGGTVIVTLEPCAHQGKQPPCTDALIEAGVLRVVAAIADPTPQAGGGRERLRRAGISTSLGLLAREARRQNAAWFHQHTGAQRPFVALKLATSLDHRIADRSGATKWLSGAPAREYVHVLRAGFDAIAVGGRTAIQDDPQLTVRGPIVPRVPPRRVVFQGHEPLPSTLRAVTTSRAVPTVVVSSIAAEAATRSRLGGSGVDIIAATSLAEAFGKLRAKGIGSMLVEGGGRLAGGLLREGLVDRFFWIQCPLWIGDGGIPAISGWDPGALEVAERWSVAERRALGEDTLLVLDRVGAECSPES